MRSSSALPSLRAIPLSALRQNDGPPLKIRLATVIANEDNGWPDWQRRTAIRELRAYPGDISTHKDRILRQIYDQGRSFDEFMHVLNGPNDVDSAPAPTDNRSELIQLVRDGYNSSWTADECEYAVRLLKDHAARISDSKTAELKQVIREGGSLAEFRSILWSR
jgi:hypothetical protein